MSICHICDNSTNNKIHVAREMMFGYRDEFEYLECDRCGCVQILEFPSNISRYYPDNYYSFRESVETSEDERSLITIFADRQRVKHYLGYGGWSGRFFAKRRNSLLPYGGSSLHFLDWLKEAKVRLDYEIIDIGCGNGHLLLELKENGFANLTGLDPFIEDNIFHENGVRIFKKEIHEVTEKFDFAMLNHSLEHIQNQLLVIKELYRILKPNRYAMVRIPIASFAWNKYQTNWVQLDAPRHLFIHTVDSLRLLAEKAGFKLAKVIYDSTEFQFLGSERYVKNTPLICSEKPYKPTQEESDIYRDEANHLNINNDGDQACFYLYKGND